MDGRKQFTFYRSYFEAVRELPKRDQTTVLLAVCAYALDGVEPDLTGTAKAVFTLIRPTLDVSNRKAENGLRGGRPKANEKQTANKPKPNQKQTASEKEGEKEVEIENEIEIENECYPCSPLSAAEKAKPREEEAFGRVMSAYMDRIAALPSDTCIAALRDFCAALGPEVCMRAIDTAIDAQKPTWPYINAILRDKQARGIDSLAKWDELEKRRKPAAAAQEASEDQSEADQKAVESMLRMWDRIQKEEA